MGQRKNLCAARRSVKGGLVRERAGYTYQLIESDGEWLMKQRANLFFPYISIAFELCTREPSRDMSKGRNSFDEVAARDHDIGEDVYTPLGEGDMPVIMTRHLQAVGYSHNDCTEQTGPHQNKMSVNQKPRG